MFKYSDVIKNVKSFELENENFYYSEGKSLNERIVMYCAGNESVQITKPNKVFSIRNSQHPVSTWVNIKGKAIKFNKGKAIAEINNFLVLNEISENITIGREAGKENFVLRNLNETIQELSFSSTIFKVHLSRLYTVLFNNTLNRKQLSCYNLKTLEQEWVFDIEKYSTLNEKEIDRIIVINDSSIWLALSKHTVIKLSKEQGELLTQIEKIEDFNCDWLPSAIPESKSTQLYDNNLIGLRFEFFWEINTETNLIELEDLTSYFKSNKIRNDNPDNIIIDGKIIFISRHESKIGALNISTKKLDWIHKFEMNEEGRIPEITEIKANKSILLARDRGNNLFVFKREKLSTTRCIKHS